MTLQKSNRGACWRFSCVLLLATLLDVNFMSELWAGANPDWIIHPRLLRESATVAPLPEFPLESVRAGITGVAVAEIDVRQADGHIFSVRVLEAPDSRIAATVLYALHQWRFEFRDSLSIKTGQVLRSRIVFYFRIIDSRPVVIDAAAEDLKKHPTTNTSTKGHNVSETVR